MESSAMKLALKKISVALLAALAAAAAVETALRLFWPRYYPVIVNAYEYDPELAFRLRPGAHLFSTTDHQQESITNGLGTANFQQSFEGYETLVFAVGDSYTQGTGLPADMSYPSQLDLMLNRDEQGFYVKKAGVVNLGVAGFGGEQELISLRRGAEQIGAPSVILYVGCDNDFMDDLDFRGGGRHMVVLPGNPVWGRLGAPMRVALVRTQIGIRLRAGILEWRLGRLAHGALGGMERRPPVAELQSSVLERLASFAGQHGSLLVVTWSDDGESYGWLKGWAEGNGVAFADWAPKAASVRAALPALPPDNQHSGGHHRGWLNRVIAEEFARQMRARGR